MKEMHMAEKAGTTKDKAATKATATTEEKKTRNVLTPQQRIEKAKADLAALEAKEAERAKSKLDSANELVKKLTEKRDSAQAKLDEATNERDMLNDLVNGEPATQVDAG